ncbi:MAG: LLM class flavin-dependent oxidoreductase [Bacillota bacterium]|nr:LLM class flavin-dependent oxidoreductase [Bacillota bacterium]
MRIDKIGNTPSAKFAVAVTYGNSFDACGILNPMRKGIFFTLDYHPDLHPAPHVYLQETLELMELCDELGLEIWVSEHHFSYYGLLPSPAVFLGAAAQRTKKVRLGTAVAVVPIRHPLHLAEDYGLVDILSGGRLEVAVGSGYLSQELAPFGVTPETKHGLFEDHLAIWRQAWRGEPIRHEGEFLTLESPSPQILPLQKPHPPFWFSITRPEPAQAIGKRGEDLLTVPYIRLSSQEDLASLLYRYREGRRQGGHGPGKVGVAVHAFAGYHRYLWGEGKVEEYQPYQQALDLYLKTRLQPGARSRGDASPDFVWLGNPEEIRSRIDTYEAMGVELLLFMADVGGLPRSLVRSSLKGLAAAFA